jgi:heme o synthase
MRRTANRPLPASRVSAREAFAYGILLSIAGGACLAVLVNWTAAALAVSTLLSYLLIYTPLKRKTPLCTLLGAFPGAMPTLIGCAGASSRIDSHAWFLFGILFLWQFPHFLAIAFMYREDYVRAGYKMLPDFDADGRFTRAEVLAFSMLLVLATIFFGSRTAISLVTLSLAGAFLLYPTIKLLRTSSRNMASRVVHASVIYLPIVLIVTAVSKS